MPSSHILTGLLCKKLTDFSLEVIYKYSSPLGYTFAVIASFLLFKFACFIFMRPQEIWTKIYEIIIVIVLAIIWNPVKYWSIEAANGIRCIESYIEILVFTVIIIIAITTVLLVLRNNTVSKTKSRWLSILFLCLGFDTVFDLRNI